MHLRIQLFHSRSAVLRTCEASTVRCVTVQLLVFAVGSNVTANCFPLALCGVIVTVFDGNTVDDKGQYPWTQISITSLPLTPYKQ
jgi:hypothetical protein